MRYFFLIVAMLLSGASFAQVIDAESYIYENGYQKKAQGGAGTFYTTIKRVSAEGIRSYMEAVKGMPRTDEAGNLCRNQAIGAKKQLDKEGRGDLRLSDSIGYGGPQEGKFGCVIFYEHNNRIAGAQVYFLKTVSKGSAYETFTVIVTH